MILSQIIWQQYKETWSVLYWVSFDTLNICDWDIIFHENAMKLMKLSPYFLSWTVLALDSLGFNQEVILEGIFFTFFVLC